MIGRGSVFPRLSGAGLLLLSVWWPDHPFPAWVLADRFRGRWLVFNVYAAERSSNFSARAVWCGLGGSFGLPALLVLPSSRFPPFLPAWSWGIHSAYPCTVMGAEQDADLLWYILAMALMMSSAFAV